MQPALMDMQQLLLIAGILVLAAILSHFPGLEKVGTTLPASAGIINSDLKSTRILRTIARRPW
jgi:hypothetical protein